jgi:hypothetical protein
MNVDKPAPSTDGAAHIRGAEGTIMVVLSRRPTVQTMRLCGACVSFGCYFSIKDTHRNGGRRYVETAKM